MVVRNDSNTSEYSPDMIHPVFDGGADAAVDATLQWMDWFYEDRNEDMVVWADIHPIKEGTTDLLDAMRVYGDTWGTPAAVVGGLGEPIEGVEFRPITNRPYVPIRSAANYLFIREDIDTMPVAVVPRKEAGVGRDHLYKGAWIGEIHVPAADGVRVWPMDWRFLMDAPTLDDAAAAASTQMRLWRLHQLETSGEHPDAIGRLYKFDGGDEGRRRLYGSGVGQTWLVRPSGDYERWDDPFELEKPYVSRVDLSW